MSSYSPSLYQSCGSFRCPVPNGYRFSACSVLDSCECDILSNSFEAADKFRWLILHGTSTCTISIIRIEFLNNGEDFTYNNIAPAGWSLGELCAGITCACLPTLRPLLFRVVSPKLGSFNLTKRKASMANLIRAGSIRLKSKSSSVSEPANNSATQNSERSLGTADEEAENRGQLSSFTSSDDGHLVSEDRSQVFRNVM